jgi:hypothetical protein
MPAAADGCGAGSSQIAWTLMVSVSTGLTGVSLAWQAVILPFAFTSSNVTAPLRADLSQ